MKKKTLYIILALLVLLNIGQFVYFYSFYDLKRENEIFKLKNNEKILILKLKDVEAKLNLIQKSLISSKVLDKDKTVLRPSIDDFYQYIYSLDNRVGKEDLPFMKQDIKDKNKFYFEWCLNPPDCNKTKISTYVFNGSTFIKQEFSHK